MRIHPNILERNRKDFEERGGYAMFAYMFSDNEWANESKNK